MHAADFIGAEITVDGVTGTIIRSKDKETLVLFDGKKNHDIKIKDNETLVLNDGLKNHTVAIHELKQQTCTGCKKRKMINQFKQFKSGKYSKRCASCRIAHTTPNKMENIDRRKDMHDTKLEEPILKETPKIEIESKKVEKKESILKKQPKTKIEDILLEKTELYYKKNVDYGNSFEELMNEYGLIALAIRLSDKLNRLKQLEKFEQKVMDESIQDTLIDISNYADMGIMWLRNKEDENV